MAIRPVYSKLILLSRKSLEIIINIKIKFKKLKIIKKLEKKGGCPLIRACSLIRSNTVYVICAFFSATVIIIMTFAQSKSTHTLTLSEPMINGVG